MDDELERLEALADAAEESQRVIRLEPCPACGANAQILVEFHELFNNDSPAFRIMCRVCGWQPDGTAETADKAAEEWNGASTKKD